VRFSDLIEMGCLFWEATALCDKLKSFWRFRHRGSRMFWGACAVGSFSLFFSSPVFGHVFCTCVWWRTVALGARSTVSRRRVIFSFEALRGDSPIGFCSERAHMDFRSFYCFFGGRRVAAGYWQFFVFSVVFFTVGDGIAVRVSVSTSMMCNCAIINNMLVCIVFRLAWLWSREIL